MINIFDLISISQLASTRMTIWRRNCYCLLFYYWNWNWKQFCHSSSESLASKQSKHWSYPNWLLVWLLDSLHIACSRNQLHQPHQRYQRLLHHHTIQVAGNQVLQAAAHMHAFGMIHLVKIWLIALITAATRQSATAAADHQLLQNRPPIPHFKTTKSRIGNVIK